LGKGGKHRFYNKKGRLKELGLGKGLGTQFLKVLTKGLVREGSKEPQKGLG